MPHDWTQILRQLTGDQAPLVLQRPLPATLPVAEDELVRALELRRALAALAREQVPSLMTFSDVTAACAVADENGVILHANSGVASAERKWAPGHRLALDADMALALSGNNLIVFEHVLFRGNDFFVDNFVR